MQDNKTDKQKTSSDFSDAVLEDGYQENSNFEQFIQNIDENNKNNLIVNYLPSTITPLQLRELFQEYGELESVRLMQDKVTKISLGYGFVKFVKEEDAKKAIENLNGKTIENKTLKVNFAKQNGQVKKNSNIYIAYLNPLLTDKSVLMSHFEKFGTIVESTILIDERGVSKGVGFIRFENREDAEKAISMMNGNTDPQICNSVHPLVVKFSESEKRKDKMGGNKNTFRPPFLKNYAMFNGYRYSPYGGAYDRAPNPYQAPYPNPYPYPPPPTIPNYGGYSAPNPYTPSYPTKNFHSQLPNDGALFSLFVYNLPPDTDDNFLYRLFSPFGNVASVKVIKEPTTGQCKGYSFVNFYKYEEAYAAVTGLNGTSCGTKTLQVSFKKQK